MARHPHSYPWHDYGKALIKADDTKPSNIDIPKTVESNPQAAAGKTGTKTYQAIASKFGTIKPGTTPNINHFQYSPKMTNKITNLLGKHGYTAYKFGGKYGAQDLANKHYGTGHVAIYDPTPGQGGSFSDESTTWNWRRMHELAHAKTLNGINAKYGEGGRLGRLGMPRTPNEVKRSIEWEWDTMHKQRELSKELGIHIPDKEFHKELNTVMADAVHRGLTGVFTNPEDEGFHAHDHKVPLEHALGMVDDAAKRMGLRHDHDSIPNQRREGYKKPVTKSEAIFQELGISDDSMEYQNYWKLLNHPAEDHNVTVSFPLEDYLEKSDAIEQIYGVLEKKQKIRTWANNHGAYVYLDAANTLSMLVSNKHTDDLEDLIDDTQAQLKIHVSDLIKSEDGPIHLTHYSTTPGLKELDPAKMGTGIGSAGAESKHGRPNIDRTYFYREGTQPEPMVHQRSKAKYSAILSPNQQLYDLGKDPEGIYGQLKEAAGKRPTNPGLVTDDEYLQAVKDAGYHGYYNSQSALSNAVALFHKHPVTEDLTFKKSEGVDLEGLEKVEHPPSKMGERHPTKPYVAKKHPSGGLVWHYNNETANQIDNIINQSKEPFIANHPKEHQPIIRAFIDKVSTAHTRHAVPAKDTPNGPDIARARHIAGMMQNGQNYSLQVHDPNNLTLHIHERHGENPRPSNIKFSKVSQTNADKIINSPGGQHGSSNPTTAPIKKSLGSPGRDKGKTGRIPGETGSNSLDQANSLGLYPGRIPRTPEHVRLTRHSGRQDRSESPISPLQPPPLNKTQMENKGMKPQLDKAATSESVFDYGHHFGEPKETKIGPPEGTHIGQDPGGPDPFGQLKQPTEKIGYFKKKLNKLKSKNYFLSKLPKSPK